MDQTVQVFPPHLKKVLKSYQAAATTSLQGPNSVMGIWEDKMGAAAATKISSSEKKASAASKCSDYDTFVAPPPFPIQQPPIFTPPDQSRCERSETRLESEIISCFEVGGEKRLCLPQILNTVLRDFSLQQINSVCDELHIFCSRCNPEQLEVLKVTGILPLSAPSCGLITKTDAERLCSALLHSNPPKSSMRTDDKRAFHIKVYHQCFGKTQGVFWPDLYQAPNLPCVECSECRSLFNPQTFVCHTHNAKNRTCHWGFDSLNWKCYLLLSKDQEHSKQYRDHLEEVKRRFDHCQKFKRKQISDDVENTKRFCIEENPYSTLLWDPALAYWYASWARMCGIKPWPHAKERKHTFVPTNLPSYLRESLSISVPSYIAHDASLPLDADVMSDINRHYSSHHDPFLKKRKVSSHTETNISNALPTNIKNEPWLQEDKEIEENQFDTHNDSEDTMSDTTLSTLSGAEAVLESADEDESDVFDNDFSDLKKLLEENNLDKETCEKILTQVKLLIIKNRNTLYNALYSKKVVQKELEKMRNARRLKFSKMQKDKKNIHQEIEKMKNEFKEHLSEIKDTKELFGWEYQNKDSEKSNTKNPDYLHLLSRNEFLQKQVFSLQREIDKMKDYLAESSSTTLEENENSKSVGDILTSSTAESTEKKTAEAAIK